MKRSMKWHMSVSIMLVFSLLLTACGGSKKTEDTKNNTEATSTSTSAPTAQPSAKPAKPTDISIMTIQQTPESLPADNVVQKAIEKITNSKMNITWVPLNTYNEKLKITLASGDIPDLTLILNTFDPQVISMAKAGAFWDLTPFIKDYKNLSALPADSWENSKISGKNYGIPRPIASDGGGVAPMIRKDWLDKLGLQVPQTMDDMYQYAKAVTEKDPDGNGKNDTFGLTGNVDPAGMGSLVWVEQTLTGAPGFWKLKNGELTASFLDPGTRQSLEWLKRAYDEKILTPDFGVLKSTQAREMFMGNKAGILGAAIPPQWLFMDALLKIDPKADVYPLPPLTGPEGKFAFKLSGFYGMYVIPKTVPEDKVKQLLAFMDYGDSKEGADLASFGFKDVHYTEKDGFKVATDKAKTDMVGSTYLGQIFTRVDKYKNAFLSGIPKDVYDRNVQVIDERAKVSVVDPGFKIISESFLKYGPDLQKKIQDLKVKVIMGTEPITAWDDFVNKMKTDAQLQAMTKEVNEAYKNS